MRHDQTTERWYQRAYELTKSRALKASAAYLAAKAEHGILIDTRSPDDDKSDLPIATTWFEKLEQLSNTRYYKEVLEECGTFRTWMGK